MAEVTINNSPIHSEALGIPPDPPDPPTPTPQKRKKFKWVLYAEKIRLKRRNYI